MSLKKTFIKLMNTSVFGKIMGNVKKHKNIELVASQEKYGKDVMKPNLKDGYPYSKELFAAEMGKIKIKMKKPMHPRPIVLDLINTMIYEF